ncbi:MAG: hypothetical protein FWG84_04535, partial [Bacteroidales bacterium]|nr:hypothetical protein [Bacteroidales bacterium]
YQAQRYKTFCKYTNFFEKNYTINMHKKRGCQTYETASHKTKSISSPEILIAASLCDPGWGRMLKNVNSAINIRPLRGHIMLKINLLK